MKTNRAYNRPIQIDNTIFVQRRYQALLSSIIFILISLTMFTPSTTDAEEQSLSLKQMLLSPGDLTQAHAEIETKCESCHTHFDKSNQTPLCLDCHEQIDEDLNLKNGFHGNLEETKTNDCKGCHTDHRGRDFNINGLDKDNFDHSKTNFVLEFHHNNASCETCHDNNATADERLKLGLLELPSAEGYRFSEFECASCHIDYHEESLGKECDSCHTAESWQVTQFDHQQTDFVLDGKHQDVECSSCHLDNQFEQAKTTCESCHLAEEPHLGVFGAACVDCHTTEKWKNDTYDHFKETGFVLEGSHSITSANSINCIDCHAEELKPKSSCLTCHKNDDLHQGSNGEECQDCHNQKKWDQTSFKHNDSTTGFELDGAHQDVDCESCHQLGKNKNSKFDTQITVRQCGECHKSDDPHGSEISGDCQDCHNSTDWTDSVRFNHDFSNFPLTGSHQLLVCESCHLTSEFSEESASCNSCHKDDDVHQKSLGENCEGCHDSSTWSHWQFDHDSQTKFFLEGSHKNLKCELCHNDSFSKPLNPGKDCISCHRDDDIHRGALGTDCKQCHTENDFGELVF